MIMWLAVIIGVYLAVEFLSYLTGGESRPDTEAKTEEKSYAPTQTSLKTHP